LERRVQNWLFFDVGNIDVSDQEEREKTEDYEKIPIAHI
jgi:hypothetical protein